MESYCNRSTVETARQVARLMAFPFNYLWIYPEGHWFALMGLQPNSYYRMAFLSVLCAPRRVRCVKSSLFPTPTQNFSLYTNYYLTPFSGCLPVLVLLKANIFSRSSS